MLWDDESGIAAGAGPRSWWPRSPDVSGWKLSYFRHGIRSPRAFDNVTVTHDGVIIATHIRVCPALGSAWTAPVNGRPDQRLVERLARLLAAVNL